jgi:hypothetical protein
LDDNAGPGAFTQGWGSGDASLVAVEPVAGMTNSCLHSLQRARLPIIAVSTSNCLPQFSQWKVCSIASPASGLRSVP